MPLAVDLDVVRMDLVDDVLDHLARGVLADRVAVGSGVEIEVDPQEALRPSETFGEGRLRRIRRRRSQFPIDQQGAGVPPQRRVASGIVDLVLVAAEDLGLVEGVAGQPHRHRVIAGLRLRQHGRRAESVVRAVGVEPPDLSARAGHPRAPPIRRRRDRAGRRSPPSDHGRRSEGWSPALSARHRTGSRWAKCFASGSVWGSSVCQPSPSIAAVNGMSFAVSWLSGVNGAGSV